MAIHPIFKTLARKKLAVFLLSLQIAITLAVFSNTLVVMGEQDKVLSVARNLPEQDMIYVFPQNYSDDFRIEEAMERDLYMLRNNADIIAATPAWDIPSSARNRSFYTSPDEEAAQRYTSFMFDTDEYGPEVFDLKLLSGRFFTADEVVYFNKDETSMIPGVVIISESLSNLLFPAGNALGKNIWFKLNGSAVKIIGIYQDFLGGHVYRNNKYQTMLRPQVYWQKKFDPNYIIRTKPGKALLLKNKILNEMSKMDKRYIHEVGILQDMINRVFDEIELVNILFSIFTYVMTVVVTLGIAGLASYAVTERQKEIGIRRALGASKRQIMQLLVAEKMVVALIAVIMGIGISIGLSIISVNSNLASTTVGVFELSACSFIIMVVVCLATYFPVRRSALIDPAIVTKTA